MKSPNLGTGDNHLQSLAAVGPNDIWAVGTYNRTNTNDATSQALIEHWNGTSWSAVPSPNSVDGTSSLNAVAGTGPTDVWAVGFASFVAKTHTLIEHWNGHTWTTLPTPATGPDSRLYGVVALSKWDAWAVGSYAAESGRHALILHWNGYVWSQVPGPKDLDRDSVLWSVAASGWQDVWAVGQVTEEGIDRPLVVHWDGAGWSNVSSRASERPHAGAFRAVTVRAADDVWAVGYSIPAKNVPRQPLVAHWDGARWNLMAVPANTMLDAALYGVAAVARDDVWAVGAATNNGCDQVRLLHWDGRIWSNVANPLDGEHSLIGVAACAANDVWIVGRSRYGDCWSTLALHYTCTVQPVPKPTRTPYPPPPNSAAGLEPAVR